MPKIKDVQDMAEFKTAAKYKFSGIDVEDFEGAAEQTLVGIIQDVSGSVHPYQKEMTDCLKTILGACQQDPRAENQMVRLVLFNERLEEVHGFRFLADIDPDEYNDILAPGGGTALFDGTHTAIEAVQTYGESLVDAGVDVNAILFVITDGDDNSSKYGPKQIKELLEKVRSSEKIESILVVLVGITDNRAFIQNYLDNFKDEARLDAFVDIGDATKSSLAKLAKFISQSISSQSKSLNSGGASKILTF